MEQQSMNIYFIEGEDIEVLFDRVETTSITEIQGTAEIVAAPSRGRAKRLFIEFCSVVVIFLWFTP